jgi:hypothetical protein
VLSPYPHKILPPPLRPASPLSTTVVLGTPQYNEGTTRLHSELAPECVTRPDVQAKVRSAAATPEARAKITVARRGKPRPASVREAIGRIWRGTRLPAAMRAKLSAAHKGKPRPPGLRGEPWTPDEDLLLDTLPPSEVAARTGRTLMAEYERRRRLRHQSQ